MTLVCQTIGEERLVRRLRSSGPLSSEASGTAPIVLPVLPFRRCACSVFVYLSPHALQRVPRPVGPRRHSGVERVPQWAHRFSISPSAVPADEVEVWSVGPTSGQLGPSDETA